MLINHVITTVAQVHADASSFGRVCKNVCQPYPNHWQDNAVLAGARLSQKTGTLGAEKS